MKLKTKKVEESRESRWENKSETFEEEKEWIHGREENTRDSGVKGCGKRER